MASARISLFTSTLVRPTKTKLRLTECACHIAKDLTLEEIDLLWAEPEYIESRRAITSQAMLDKKTLELKDATTVEVRS